MNVLLALHQAQWDTIFTIPKGTPLQKGRHGIYHDIVRAAALVNVRFGCYSWGNDSEIFYCGSFAKDYSRGNFKSNLHGRIHNYLQNHKLKKSTGRKNTNLMVFERINETLKFSNISVRLLVFEALQIGDDEVDYATFSSDSDLVHAIEQLLIATYRRHNQCQWNRT